jgi:ArsR family transcriptional regulator
MASTTVKRLSVQSRIFHALSDETRLQIIDQLKDGEQCVCDMTDAFKTGQSRLSFHLKVLKGAGLIVDRPEGRWTYYSLNREALEELEEIVHELRMSVSRSTKKSRCL